MSHDIPTYRISNCEHCGQPIAEIRDPHSDALDWYSHGGDFGCAQSPESGDEGCGSHEPSMLPYGEPRGRGPRDKGAPPVYDHGEGPASAWVYTEAGALQAHGACRIDKVFVAIGATSATSVLRVEVNRAMIAGEGPAELFQAILDLPTLVLKPGQMIELIDEERRRVPCTWLVTTLNPPLQMAPASSIFRGAPSAPSARPEPTDPFSLPEDI